MKLIRADADQFQFEISREEKSLLNILQLYPLVPAAHHRLSRGRKIPNRVENQQLLEEALHAQREENQKKVQMLLAESQRFVASTGGYEAAFSRSEMEWLLQVFNDIRVGSWLALGSPDQHPEIREGTSHQDMSRVVALNVAGFFEMCLLQAIHGDASAGHE
jgi:hypothetical protein